MDLQFSQGREDQDKENLLEVMFEPLGECVSSAGQRGAEGHG